MQLQGESQPGLKGVGKEGTAFGLTERKGLRVELSYQCFSRLPTLPSSDLSPVVSRGLHHPSSCGHGAHQKKQTKVGLALPVCSFYFLLQS